MCLKRKHVEYLGRTNEEEYRQRKISYETYVRLCDIVERCELCDLFDNGVYGDIHSECRIHIVRLFVSMTRDAEAWADKRLKQQLAEAEAAQSLPETSGIQPAKPPSDRGESR